jgi:dihydrofolate reductase
MKIRARMSMSADGYVTTPERPAGTPDHVVCDGDPARLLEQLRAANRGGDVHLVGGPRTIETFRALGAVDRLELVVLPLLFGGGMQLTPALSPDAQLRFERSRPLAGGSVEIVYDTSGGGGDALPGRQEGWAPASQRRS